MEQRAGRRIGRFGPFITIVDGLCHEIQCENRSYLGNADIDVQAILPPNMHQTHNGGNAVDWDRIRIFYTVAESGSFTQGWRCPGLESIRRQPADRRAGARAACAAVPSAYARTDPHRARRTALARRTRDDAAAGAYALAALGDARASSGELKVTATRGLGGHWLTPRLAEFLDLYPDIKVELILTDEELDLSMREADIAIRLRQPQQPDLIQRKLFTVHFHVYGSPAYIKRFGEPKSYDDLDNHRILSFGGTSPSYLTAVHWLGTLGATSATRARSISP